MIPVILLDIPDVIYYRETIVVTSNTDIDKSDPVIIPA